MAAGLPAYSLEVAYPVKGLPNIIITPREGMDLHAMTALLFEVARDCQYILDQDARVRAEAALRPPAEPEQAPPAPTPTSSFSALMRARSLE